MNAKPTLMEIKKDKKIREVSPFGFTITNHPSRLNFYGQ
jgi:hypothetical protein